MWSIRVILTIFVIAWGVISSAPSIEVREQRPGYTGPNLGLSRLPEPIRGIPESITVVPQELMREQGVTNLRDALRNVTGISFQAGEGASTDCGRRLHEPYHRCHRSASCCGVARWLGGL
jgi:outer membrane receptor for monomeric catechols